MKRTPLRRKTPLARSPAPLRRTPLSPVSQRLRLQRKALEDWAAVVKAVGRCEGACLPGECWGPLEAHHVFTKGRYPELVDDLRVGCCTCQRHHRWAHENPIEAGVLGFLAPLVSVGVDDLIEEMAQRRADCRNEFEEACCE